LNFLKIRNEKTKKCYFPKKLEFCLFSKIFFCSRNREEKKGKVVLFRKVAAHYKLYLLAWFFFDEFLSKKLLFWGAGVEIDD